MFFQPFVSMDTDLRKKDYSSGDIERSLKKFNEKLLKERRVKKIKNILDICKSSLSPTK